MINVDLVSCVLGVAIGVCGAVTVVFPTIKAKGIDTQSLIDKADLVLTGVDSLIGVADKILPNNPAVNVLKLIDKYAHIGVNQAEQLYIASQLPAEQRNAKAKDTINAALKTIGIEVTPEIEKIIDGAIEAEVLALGHKEPTDAEKETEKQTLQAQVIQLTTENTNLKNTISQVNATTSNVVQSSAQ